MIQARFGSTTLHTATFKPVHLIPRHFSCEQWPRHTKACQGICPSRNSSALAAALALKGGNNKIIYQDILTALTDATSDLSKCLCPAMDNGLAPPLLVKRKEEKETGTT